MGQAQPDQITLLLQQMKNGDGHARDMLASLVYPHLKKIAVQHMRRERPDHTLQPTALVHEVFLRLAGSGGGEVMLELEEWQARIHEHPEIVLEVDRLLTRLNALDERQAKVVEMRYFAGLTEEEIAEALGVSERTVKRDWTMARAWMRKELSV